MTRKKQMNQPTGRLRRTRFKWIRVIPPWPLFIFLLLFTSLLPLLKLRGQPEGNPGSQEQLEQGALNAPGKGTQKDPGGATKETE
jgi:hypothetical protein